MQVTHDDLQSDNNECIGTLSKFTVHIVEDRGNDFIVKDERSPGQAFFHATNILTGSGDGSRKVTAVAVREHENAKFCKALWFMHALPPSLSRELEKWLAVPKEECAPLERSFKGLMMQLQSKLRPIRLQDVCLSHCLMLMFKFVNCQVFDFVLYVRKSNYRMLQVMICTSQRRISGTYPKLLYR